MAAATIIRLDLSISDGTTLEIYYVLASFRGCSGCYVIAIDSTTGELVFEGVPSVDVFSGEQDAVKSLRDAASDLSGVTVSVTIIGRYCAILGGFRAADTLHLLMVCEVEDLTLFGPGTNSSFCKISKTEWIQIPLRCAITTTDEGRTTSRPSRRMDTSDSASIAAVFSNELTHRLLKCSLESDCFYGEDFCLELPLGSTIVNAEDGNAQNESSDEFTWNAALRSYFTLFKLGYLCRRVVYGTIQKIGNFGDDCSGILVCRRSLVGVDGASSFTQLSTSFEIPHETELELIVARGSNILSSEVWRCGGILTLPATLPRWEPHRESWDCSKRPPLSQLAHCILAPEFHESDVPISVSPLAKFFLVLAERYSVRRPIKLICLEWSFKSQLTHTVFQIKEEVLIPLSVAREFSLPVQADADEEQVPLMHFVFASMQGMFDAMVCSGAMIAEMLQRHGAPWEAALNISLEAVLNLPLARNFLDPSGTALRTHLQSSIRNRCGIASKVDIIDAELNSPRLDLTHSQAEPPKWVDMQIVAKVPWKLQQGPLNENRVIRHLTARRSGFALIDVEFPSTSGPSAFVESVRSASTISHQMGVKLCGVQHVRLTLAFPGLCQLAGIAFRSVPLVGEELCCPPMYFSLLLGDTADRNRMTVVFDHAPIPQGSPESRFAVFSLATRGFTYVSEIVPFNDDCRENHAQCAIVDLITAPAAAGIIYFLPLIFGRCLRDSGAEDLAHCFSGNGADFDHDDSSNAREISSCGADNPQYSLRLRSAGESNACSEGLVSDVGSMIEQHPLVETYSRVRTMPRFGVVSFSLALRMEYRCRATARANCDAASRDRHLWQVGIPRWKMNPEAYIVPGDEAASAATQSVWLLRHFQRDKCVECGASISVARRQDCLRCGVILCQRCAAVMPVHERAVAAATVCQKCRAEVTDEMRMIVQLTAKDAETAEGSQSSVAQQGMLHIAHPSFSVPPSFDDSLWPRAIGHLSQVIFAPCNAATGSAFICGAGALPIPGESKIVILFPMAVRLAFVQFSWSCRTPHERCSAATDALFMLEARIGKTLSQATRSPTCATIRIEHDSKEVSRRCIKMDLSHCEDSCRLLGLSFVGLSSSLGVRVANFDIHAFPAAPAASSTEHELRGASNSEFTGFGAQECLTSRNNVEATMSAALLESSRGRSSSRTSRAAPVSRSPHGSRSSHERFTNVVPPTLLGQFVSTIAPKATKYVPDRKMVVLDLGSANDGICGLMITRRPNSLHLPRARSFRVTLIRGPSKSQPVTEITLPSVQYSSRGNSVLLFPFHQIFDNVSACHLRAVTLWDFEEAQMEEATSATALFDTCALFSLPDLSAFHRLAGTSAAA